MRHPLSTTGSVAPQSPGRTPHEAPQAPFAVSRRRHSAIPGGKPPDPRASRSQGGPPGPSAREGGRHMSALVTVEEIKAAARRVDGVIVKTPLIPFPDTEPRLLIKPESLQPTGSVKLRGAFSAISALSDAQRERGAVAAC